MSYKQKTNQQRYNYEEMKMNDRTHNYSIRSCCFFNGHMAGLSSSNPFYLLIRTEFSFSTPQSAPIVSPRPTADGFASINISSQLNILKVAVNIDFHHGIGLKWEGAIGIASAVMAMV